MVALEESAIHAELIKALAAAPIVNREHMRALDRWGEAFGDDVVAAKIDHLVHHAGVIALKGDSYRIKDRDLGRVPAGADDQ